MMNFQQFLYNLVSFDTVSSNSNLPLISFAEYHLKKLGFATEQFCLGNKANLFAFKQAGNRIIFAGHTDTVPPSPNYSTNPFDLTLRTNKFIGLGVADMKGFLALALEIAMNKREDKRLAFLLTFDEELDFAGAKSIPKSWIKPDDLIILGEPTDLQIIPCHKGLLQYKIKIFGKGGHGSEPGKGVSAILEIAKFINYFESAFKRNLKKPDLRFSNPLPTFNIGIIKGGEAVNIIPELAELDLDVRILSDEDEVVIDKLISDFQTGAKLSFEKVVKVPPFGSLVPDFKIDVGKGTSYTTEASFFQNYTNKILLFGPGKFADAHIADESLLVSSVESYREKILQILEAKTDY